MIKKALLLKCIVCVLLLPGIPLAGAVDDALLSKLRQGGYVIFFRHAATDHSQKDTNISDLKDCQSQRNLNDLGRTQSKVVGQSFKALNIPVGQIFSSHLCRCLNTATLAFGRATPVMELTSIQGKNKAEVKRRINAIRKVLSQIPQGNTNTVMVSHKYLFKWTTGVELEEGEAAIFKPDGSRFHFVTQIEAKDWAQTAGVTGL